MTTSNNSLQLAPALVDLTYLNEWNQHSTDFVQLYKDGKLLRETLYRVGGIGTYIGGKYFTLLKYVEAKYTLDFLKMCHPEKKQNELKKFIKHLECHSVILDKHGNEKRVFKPHQTPYVIANSCIYSLDGIYYNIETGERYGSNSRSIQSNDFIFVENSYGENKGVMKINKKDGTWELFQ